VRFLFRCSRVLVLLILPFHLCFAQSKDHELWPEWVSIVDSFGLNIPEAKERLERLLTQDPRFYRAHSLYWRAVGRTEDEDARRSAVERSLPHFDTAPADHRDERFYSTYIQGLEILGQDDEIARIKAEAISRFPRGLLAQLQLLDRAKASEDPAQAVKLYNQYLDEFADNTSWADFAARDRFKVIHKNPDAFGDEALEAAAKDVAEYCGLSVSTQRNPSRYLSRMEMLVDAFGDKNPKTALLYARKGVVFVAERWPETDEFDQSRQTSFWPAMLAAYAKTEQWEAARRLGQRLVDALDQGLVPEHLLPRMDEQEIRRDYARALRQGGQQAAADVQLQIAADPEALTRRRAERHRPVELRADQRKPAPPFELKDLDGRPVSLRDFRGRTLILSFWATWCGPCRPELEALQQAYERLDGQAAIVAISVDDDKSGVPGYVEEMGLKFPILYSDGSVEGPYDTNAIPQLYVIDEAGMIRFHRRGFIRHGLFEQQLDWMISVVAN